MVNLRVTVTFLVAVASYILRPLVRVAKALAAPGAGPKLLAG